MTCREYRRRWNELMDAEAAAGDAALRGSEAALLAHAAECPACRTVAAGYQALRQALPAWRRPPSPPAGLVRRVLSVPDDLTPGTAASSARRRRLVWSGPRVAIESVAGLVAIVVLAASLTMLLPRTKRAPDAGPLPIVTRELHSVAGPPALDRALAEATSATWDLARSASEPAARIGREILEASADVDEAPAGLTLAVPGLDGLGSEEGASAVLEEVGDRLSSGMRPLSSTARHAFGFLLPPTRATTRPAGSNSNGARSG